MVILLLFSAGGGESGKGIGIATFSFSQRRGQGKEHGSGDIDLLDRLREFCSSPHHVEGMVKGLGRVVRLEMMLDDLVLEHGLI